MSRREASRRRRRESSPRKVLPSGLPLAIRLSGSHGDPDEPVQTMSAVRAEANLIIPTTRFVCGSIFETTPPVAAPGSGTCAVTQT